MKFCIELCFYLLNLQCNRKHMNELNSSDVRLRPLTEDDKTRLSELANNSNISSQLRDAFPHPYTIENAEQFIAMCMNHFPTQVFAIEYKGAYVGNIGLHKETDVYCKSAELGYFLGEPYWNKGIMTQAVNLICKYGFDTLDIIRIHSGIFEFNIASQRVLEKCGFTKEGIFKNAIYKNGKICDEIRYAKLISQ